jgi:hypothetical protein
MRTVLRHVFCVMYFLGKETVIFVFNTTKNGHYKAERQKKRIRLTALL